MSGTNSFTNTGSKSAASSRRRRGKKTKTKRVSKELIMKQESEKKMLQLQQQLMFLRWRKCQTGAKMRKILADSKRFKNFDVSHIAENTSALEDRSSWMQEVVESEMARPLEVDDDYIQEYIRESKDSSKRLEQDTDCHLRNVQKLKHTVLSAEQIRMRNRRYKDKLANMRGIQRVRTPANIVNMQEMQTNAKLDKLDALEQHLLHVKRGMQKVEKAKSGLLYDQPSIAASSDLFLLRVPQQISGSETENLGSLM